jgi:hypothetical protein
MDEHRQQQSAQAAYMLSGLNSLDAWLAYYGLGGQLTEEDTDAYLNGLMPIPALQRDLVAEALNERLNSQNLPGLASYADDHDS